MSSSIASPFCKTARCPKAQTLLAYHRSALVTERHVYIKEHLATCDFCSAELQLLTQCRHDPEEYLFAEMPAQLRRLAEDFLKTRNTANKGFAEMVDGRPLLP